MDFKNSWLGYDLPFAEVERQPSVQTLRANGINKRGKTSEFHVTVAYFSRIDLTELEQALQRIEGQAGSLDHSDFTFDGYGATEQANGRHVYFCPATTSAPEAFLLRQQLESDANYRREDNCSELYVNIGGPDPFRGPKPKQAPLQQAFSVSGQLIFVGNDGQRFRKYRWQDQRFVETPTGNDPPRALASKVETVVTPPIIKPQPVHTIALFPKIQADTAAAVYLLKAFGEAAFPGIAQATLAFWAAAPAGKTADDLEREGCLLIDLGGKFDHHLSNQGSGKRNDCAASLVADYLGIADHPALKKLLAWAKRDDLEGKGTMSSDSIDRAFGLSGIIMNLNREYTSQPQKIMDLILPIIAAHVREEHRRQVELPEEWQRLVAAGKIEEFDLRQGSAEIKAVLVESDHTALAGFLRASKRCDLIIQVRSSGHINLITQQLRSLDLQPTIAALRQAEAAKKGVAITNDQTALRATGRCDGVEEWYYDDAANTLQNGGVNPQGIPATRLRPDEVVAIVKRTIPEGRIGSLKRKKARELE